MATKSDFESLDEDIKELLQNYKSKKATIYEPCTHENVKECLIGLHEVSSISFVFDFTVCDCTSLH